MSSPCNNSPDEVIEKVVAAKADADKLDKFVNGTKYDTVQLGTGPATPVIRNVVAQMQAAAGAAGTYESDLEVINVKDFGAVDARNAGYTDAVLADNSLAIQAAISSAKANGGTVYIPEGVKYLRENVDANDVLVIDDSCGVRVTSRDCWWRPSPQGRPKLLLHRGLCAVYPENTVLAFTAAGQAGAYGVETDIQWTSDGYAVCMHDNTVDRTTDGSGTVASKTLSEMRALDAGSWVDSAYSSCIVPTFEEYLSVCRYFGMAPSIEIKTGDNVSLERIQSLVETVEDYGLSDTATFSSFSWYYMDWVRQCSKKIAVCCLKSGALTDDNALYLQWLGGKVLYGPDLSYLTSAEALKLKNCGAGINGWLATDRDVYDKGVSLGCTYITVNNVLA